MNKHNNAPSWWRIESAPGVTRVIPMGAWRIANLKRIEEEINRTPPSVPAGDIIILDGQGLTELYASGVLLMYRLAATAGADSSDIELVNFKKKHENITLLVRKHLVIARDLRLASRLNPVQVIGRAGIEVVRRAVNFTSFLGETSYETGRALRAPFHIRWKELAVQLERACLDAIPVVALVNFLIGVVIAYLFATQLEKYGGNIFVVDGVGTAMCRELAPLIVAIVVAGRSGSAFTAQIGTMKLNEEIDAMLTLGLSPMQVLVLPRLLALMIALPLLVFIGDAAGIFGGMLIAHSQLSITMTTFIDRLQVVIYPRTFMVGIIKAPVFAAFIAIIGCRMGLRVENNARSIGLNTTSTVVQSIVSVILLNAVFAVIFVQLGI